MIALENTVSDKLISVERIYKAKIKLKDIVDHTPLMSNFNLSERYQANVFLKREDLQIVRSYKIRGAYNKMSSLTPEQMQAGVVCASAGNHAQGVAYACHKMGVKGTIYMPSVTPQQKVEKVRRFGKEFVEIVLIGDSFDEANESARIFARENKGIFIPPFNDLGIIEGQATVGLEILEDSKFPIDYIFLPIGGGGLVSGLGSYFKHMSPNTKIIGIEPKGAPAMYESIRLNKIVKLEEIDTFVDGAAVKEVGDITFAITKEVVDDIILIDEGQVCTTILQLYNEEGIVVEPSGALSIAALEHYKNKIPGKNVVCVVSGGNNDITRTEEIKERSLIYKGLKHYFIVRFPQRAGALKDFLNNVLGPNDDITHFEYTKKHNRETGPAIIGIQLQDKADYAGLIERMNKIKFDYQVLNNSKMLFDLIV